MKDNPIGRNEPTRDPRIVDPPIVDPRIVEAIEVCRPGSDDLSDPGLAFLATELAARAELDSLFDQVQRTDGVLADVFGDPPVPEGLENRILARLAAARTEGESTEPQAAVTQRPRRLSRRLWLIAGAVGAMASSILVAALLHSRSPAEYSGQQVLELAIDLFNRPSSEPWQAVDPPRGYPLSTSLVAVRNVRWRKVDSFLGCRAVAFDMSTPGGTQATLYVVKRSVPGLPTEPPLRPTLRTGGRSTAAWQSGPLLYVLVVEGEARGYKRLLNLPRGPVA